MGERARRVGERARSIGSEAETKAWKFLESLGYRIIEKNNEEHDIDGIGRFLPKIRGGFTRPRFAPDGLTAFEVTEETLRRKKVTDFRDKIQEYNARNSDKIEGGVLLIDQKISLSMMTFMRNEKVWGWGNSRQRLHRAKLVVFNDWKEIGSTSEVALDEKTSFLRCSTAPPTTSDKLLRFAVFFDDDFTKLSLKKVTEIVSKIRENSLSPLVDVGVSPLNIHLEFHSVGGVSLTEQDFEENIVKSLRTEETNVIGKCVFADYRTFPSM
jgi:hypothetical protein